MRLVLNLFKCKTVRFNIGMQSKLIISFLMLALIPTFIVGMFSSIKLTNSIMDNTKKYSEQVLRKTSDNIQSKIDDFTLICDEILLHDAVQNGLREYNNLDIMQKRSVIKDLTYYFDKRYQILRHLTEVEIITTDGDVMYTSGYTSFSGEQIKSFIQKADQQNGRIDWAHTYLKGRDNLIMFRKLKSEKTKKGIGYIIVALHENAFSSLYRDIDLGYESKVFIIDNNSRIISSVDENIKIGQNYGDDKLNKMIFNYMGSSESSTILEIDNIKYLEINTLLNNKQWSLVTLIPYKNIVNESNQIITNIIFVSVLAIVFVVVVSIFISKKLWSPLKGLVVQMKKVEEGNFDVELSSESKDEIGYLTNSFVNMIKKIKELIQEIELKQQEKTELKIQMLQAQINPHFLFNTLNSLKWTAKISQVDSVSDGLSALARILRNTIIEKSELITIREELENINSYITIQRLRYGDSFDIHIDIQEDLLDYKILKFLLQPIVENSLIHGQKEIDYILDIKVHGYRHNNTVTIVIEDNGKGLKDYNDLVNYLNSNNIKGKISSMGIDNVNQRIKLNFGERYGLDIQQAEEQGVKTTITIPILKL